MIQNRLIAAVILVLLEALAASPARPAVQAVGDQPIVAGTFSSGMTPGGTPVGWRQKRVAGRTRFNIVKEEETAVLRVEANGGATGLFKQVTVDPKQHPIVAWRWKVERAITAADERQKKTDDAAARVFVIFKDTLPGASRYSKLKHKFASAVSSAVPPGVALCYVWASRLGKDEVIESPYTDWVRVVAVESGPEKAGRWISYERNVFEDFKKAFGKEPKQILGVALMSDTDNTNQAVVAYYGDVIFKPAQR
ncbi:MAG TPA: DUF3047 domain-containing protein [Blastocatellia bacterium]|nr:DUF3047 domain-containing protein [Blastocatellia bacterium]